MAQSPFDLDRYDHVLLDMNGTFVLDFDSFSPGHDFGATYHRAGYRALSPAEAHAAVRAAYDYLAARYVDPAYYDAFPGVAGAIVATAARPYPTAVIAELVDTFATHELGVLPPGHAYALARLRALRPLSVLSNLWAPKDRWLDRFEAWGIAALFEHLHFSCDGTEIKPHPAFFAQAVASIGLPAHRILYVGDSYARDVVGARGIGMDAVWLTPSAADALAGAHVACAKDLVAWVDGLSSRPN